MTKRLQPILVVAMILLVPALAFAGANKFAVAKAASQDGKVVVSVVVSNARPLTCLDVPLRYSEGVTLEKVTFDRTRVSYFDFKSSYIKPDERTVFIGLIAQFGTEKRPQLAVGEGEICQLHFRVDDESVSKITIDEAVTQAPNHRLTYVYRSGGRAQAIYPDFAGATVSLSNTGQPWAYALHQNYPNPFNPRTKIAYDLKKAGHVELYVYNILGQKVATLVNGHREAGSHEVTWDAEKDNAATGVYFYKIKAGEYTKTNKMILLK
ncbi:MAG: T9SS type A sorting domain-containing protein [Candidatus Zixiibacteriota bacterium]|nr:MAG: T9SS type A sorting domain-containing protein [candidate division Zixibacteria bacterium]